MFGRYDREKFAIVLSEIYPDDVQKRAHYLCEEVKHLHVAHSDGLLSGISVCSGTAVFPDGRGTVEALLTGADAALPKKAKNT